MHSGTAHAGCSELPAPRLLEKSLLQRVYSDASRCALPPPIHAPTHTTPTHHHHHPPAACRLTLWRSSRLRARSGAAHRHLPSEQLSGGAQQQQHPSSSRCCPCPSPRPPARGRCQRRPLKRPPTRCLALRVLSGGALHRTAHRSSTCSPRFSPVTLHRTWLVRGSRQVPSDWHGLM